MTPLNHLNTLESSGLIHLAQSHPELEYLFRHALIHEAAYQSLVKHDRKRLHLMVGAVLERAATDAPASREDAAVLAHHYWRGEAWSKAAEHSLRAGAGALKVYALREAIAHYARALEALDKMPDAPPSAIYDALLGWIQAAFKFRPYEEQLGRLARAERIARELNDRARLAQALYWTGHVHRASGYNVRAAPPLVECFHLAAELGDEQLAMIPTYYMALVTLDADPRAALPLFDRAAALARKYGDRDVEAYALSTRGMAKARIGEFAPAEQDIWQALALIDPTVSPMTTSDVNLYTAWSFLDMGDVPRGLEYGRRGLDQAMAADNMDCICYGFVCLGFGNLRAQQPAEAIAAFQESIRRAQFSGAAQVENLGRTGLAIAQFFSGQAEVIQDLEEALTAAHALNDQFGAALIDQALGEILTQLDEATRAADHLNAALAYYRRAGLRPYLARALQSLARLFERQGRSAEAAHARAESETVERS
ncbi:MAG TPA: hypothetical protein VJG32_14555 [Anaerolineae bacterium]|nr:hypothetical protein [Anaerolineae bacterium]